MPTISTNKELLNVINEDVKNVKQFTKMPAISEELYNEFDLFEDIKYTLDEDFLDEMLLTIKQNREGKIV